MQGKNIVSCILDCVQRSKSFTLWKIRCGPFRFPLMLRNQIRKSIRKMQKQIRKRQIISNRKNTIANRFRMTHLEIDQSTNFIERWLAFPIGKRGMPYTPTRNSFLMIGNSLSAPHFHLLYILLCLFSNN